MHHFHYEGDHLLCEGVPLQRIAGQVDTPCYIYSYATIKRHYEVFQQALSSVPHLVCFSAKANSNAAVLALLGQLGAGADIVSGGELYRALRAGIPAQRIVFSGVGKRPEEIEQALRASILLINVESEQELLKVDRIARHIGTRAPIALRVNPDVDAGTHPYISTGLRQSKFGIPLQQAWQLYEKALHLPHLQVRGIDCHIGSQLTQVEPLTEAVESVMQLARNLRAKGVPLELLDIGGGLGITYSDESPPTPAEYADAIIALVRRFSSLGLRLICEPGRVIMGNAGVLLTRVLYLKQHEDKRFVIVDAAMNDLLRPALYGAFHAIWPVEGGADAEINSRVDVVGPICETGDFIARDRPLPAVKQGDLLAIMSAGAYGSSMSSNYNSRLRAAEVMVRDDQHAVIKEREDHADLTRKEHIPEWIAKSHQQGDTRESPTGLAADHEG